MRAPVKLAFVGVVGLALVAAFAIVGLLLGEIPLLLLPLALAALLFFSARPEYAVLAILALFLAETPAFMKGIGPLTPTNALGALLAFLFLIRLARERDVSFLRAPQVLLLLLIGVLFLVGVALSPFQSVIPELGRHVTTASKADLFVGKLAFLLFVITFLRGPEHLKKALIVVVIVVTLGAVLGLLGYLSGEKITRRAPVDGAREELVVEAAVEGRPVRLQSSVIDIANNANRLAFASTFSLAILWFYTRFKRGPLHRLVLPPLLFLLVAAIFFTASRSGFLGLLILFALLFVDSHQRITGRVVMVGMAMLALAIVIAVIPQENFERILNLNPEEPSSEFGVRSLEDRLQSMEDYARAVLARPWLGVGLGLAKIAHFEVYGTFVDIATQPPHNSWLWALVEGGVFVLAAYLALFGVTWRDLRRLERSVTAPEELWIVKSSKVGLVLFLFFTMFADFWLSEFLYLIVGATLVLKARVPVAASRRVLQAEASAASAV